MHIWASAYLGDIYLSIRLSGQRAYPGPHFRLRPRPDPRLCPRSYSRSSTRHYPLAYPGPHLRLRPSLYTRPYPRLSPSLYTRPYSRSYCKEL